MLQVLAVAFELIDHAQHAGAIGHLQRLSNLFERVERESAQERTHLARIQFSATAGDGLVERRERITNAAFAGLCQDSQHLWIGFDALLTADPLHAGHHFLEIHGTKTEMLAARRDGRRNLVGFGGTQNEDSPSGRFFNGFEQGVKSFACNLVRFVDDKYFITVPRRLIAHVLPQFAHFVDPAVGGGVDFDHVDRTSGGDFDATRTHPTRLRGRALDAVQTACQDARHRSLTGAPLARKDVPVGDALLANCIFERRLDMLLVHDVRKRLRPVLPGNDLVHLCGGMLARPRVIRGTQI